MQHWVDPKTEPVLVEIVRRAAGNDVQSAYQVTEMIRRGENPNVTTADGRSLLETAIEHFAFLTARALVEGGADMFANDARAAMALADLAPGLFRDAWQRLKPSASARNWEILERVLHSPTANLAAKAVAQSALRQIAARATPLDLPVLPAPLSLRGLEWVKAATHSSSSEMSRTMLASSNLPAGDNSSYVKSQIDQLTDAKFTTLGQNVMCALWLAGLPMTGDIVEHLLDSEMRQELLADLLVSLSMYGADMHEPMPSSGLTPLQVVQPWALDARVTLSPTGERIYDLGRQRLFQDIVGRILALAEEHARALADGTVLLHTQLSLTFTTRVPNPALAALLTVRVVLQTLRPNEPACRFGPPPLIRALADRAPVQVLDALVACGAQVPREASKTAASAVVTAIDSGSPSTLAWVLSQPGLGALEPGVVLLAQQVEGPAAVEMVDLLTSYVPLPPLPHPFEALSDVLRRFLRGNNSTFLEFALMDFMGDRDDPWAVVGHTMATAPGDVNVVMDVLRDRLATSLPQAAMAYPPIAAMARALEEDDVPMVEALLSLGNFDPVQAFVHARPGAVVEFLHAKYPAIPPAFAGLARSAGRPPAASGGRRRRTIWE